MSIYGIGYRSIWGCNMNWLQRISSDIPVNDISYHLLESIRSSMSGDWQFSENYTSEDTGKHIPNLLYVGDGEWSLKVIGRGVKNDFDFYVVVIWIKTNYFETPEMEDIPLSEDWPMTDDSLILPSVDSLDSATGHWSIRFSCAVSTHVPQQFSNLKRDFGHETIAASYSYKLTTPAQVAKFIENVIRNSKLEARDLSRGTRWQDG
jgi:hypothetical protein